MTWEIELRMPGLAATAAAKAVRNSSGVSTVIASTL